MDPSFTFGPFGDLLSIALRIKEIATALTGSRGSSKRYQTLFQGLDILSTVIEEFEKLCSFQRFLTGVDETPVLALEQAVPQNLAVSRRFLRQASKICCQF